MVILTHVARMVGHFYFECQTIRSKVPPGHKQVNSYAPGAGKHNGNDIAPEVTFVGQPVKNSDSGIPGQKTQPLTK